MRKNLRLAVLILAGIVLVFLGRAAAARPNIVVMITDDQRYDAIGIVQREQDGRFGFFANATPNIDRLVQTGFRFRQAVATTALCSPARAAMLTGRYAHSIEVRNNRTPFPVGATTYATLLRGAGYRTGYFGKWHMGSQRERPGFTETASFNGQGRYFDQPFTVNGTTRQTTGWVDDVSTDFATGFIRRNADRSFAMVLGFKSPHGPNTPPPRLANAFAGAKQKRPANATAYAPYDPTPRPADAPDEWVRDYFRTLAGVDENVGRVLAELERSGILGNTIIVFTSDNGYLLGEHGVPDRAIAGDGNKRNAYEPSIRIPLVVRYPAIGGGRVIDAEALNIDLAPTLLELAGVPRPGSMQGRSLVGVMRGNQEAVRDGILYVYDRERPYYVPTLQAWRQDGMKLVRYPGYPAWEQLFDLRTDGGEVHNLARSTAKASQLRLMRSRLDAALKRTDYRPR